MAVGLAPANFHALGDHGPVGDRQHLRLSPQRRTFRTGGGRMLRSADRWPGRESVGTPLFREAKVLSTWAGAEGLARSATRSQSFAERRGGLRLDELVLRWLPLLSRALASRRASHALGSSRKSRACRPAGSERHSESPAATDQTVVPRPARLCCSQREVPLSWVSCMHLDPLGLGSPP